MTASLRWSILRPSFLAAVLLAAECAALSVVEAGAAPRDSPFRSVPQVNVERFSESRGGRGFGSLRNTEAFSNLLAQEEDGPRPRFRGPLPPRFGVPPAVRRGQPPILSPRLMQKLHDLPPQEQEKVLQNNERFQQLPKPQQERLLQRLRNFQALTPAQRETVLQRYSTFNRLTPLQRQQARNIYVEHWSAMTPERRKAVLGEFRKTRGMTPEERDKYLSGPDVESRFSPEERDVLKQLGTLQTPRRPEFAPPARPQPSESHP